VTAGSSTPSRAGTRRRLDRRDRGTGLFGSSFGLLVFLAFLLLTVHVLANLWAGTVVTTAATQAARVVASQPPPTGRGDLDGAELVRARSQAEADARTLLGRIGNQAEFDWSGSDAAQVVVTVRVPSPSVLPPGLRHTDVGVVERTAAVRQEAWR